MITSGRNVANTPYEYSIAVWAGRPVAGSRDIYIKVPAVLFRDIAGARPVEEVEDGVCISALRAIAACGSIASK